MARIPLTLRLRKQAHKDIAEGQDLIVKSLYDFFPNAVLHGGTAIWRCYDGNRFSEDVDAYIPNNPPKIDAFFNALEKNGFKIKRDKKTENSLYSLLEFNRTDVRFEALFRAKKGSLKEYETADGNFITIYTLTPEELIKEKIDAYLKRLKVRDVYDVFFLLRHIKDIKEASNDIKRLIRDYRMPLDEKELKVLIIEGIVPGTEKMLDYIKRAVK